MGIFKRRAELRAESEDAVLTALLGGSSGITAEEALQVPMVSACVEWICGTAARLPVRLYRRKAAGVEELHDDPRVGVLNLDTGDLLDDYQMKKAWCRDYLLHGAGYLYADWHRNTLTSLHYVEAKQVSVVQGYDPIFKTARFQVNGRIYPDYRFVRITRATADGVTGKGILQESPLILSVAYQTLKYQKRLVQAGGCRKGFLLSEKTVSEPVMENLRQAWKRLFKSGEENVIVLNNGVKFQEASNTSVEMQLNENKRADGESVCNLFGLSPALFSGSVTDEQYNNAVKTAVLPILDAMVKAYNRALLLEEEKGKLYFEIDTRDLLKGDIEKRFSAYRIAAEANIMQIDEIRERENLPALGFNWIKLGLQDVLYDPKTQRIYTPNTNQTGTLGEQPALPGLSQEGPPQEAEKRYNENHNPDNGQFTSGPGGTSAGAKNSSAKALTNSGESGRLKSSKPEWSAKQAKEPFNYWELAEDKNAFPVNWKPTKFADGGYLEEHVNKHITATGAKTPAEYLEKAKTFLTSPRGKHGDAFVSKNGDVFRYDYDTHEFAIARSSGTIRTYWNLGADRGANGADAYWERERVKHGR